MACSEMLFIIYNTVTSLNIRKERRALLMKKILFFDIDGTLLDHEKQVPATTKESIAELKKAGHIVAIATGRAPYHFEELREELGIDSYVCLNGQYVVYEGKPIYGHPLAEDALQETDGTSRSAGSSDYLCRQRSDEDERNRACPYRFQLGELKLTIPEYDPEYYLGRDIYQAIVFCNEDEEADYVKRFEGRFDFVRWGPYGIDVLPAGGSKAEGIKQLIQLLRIDLEDTVAFGDYLNDLEMLSYVGHGVAMGNAPEIVKQAARHVTRDVGQDGIQYGLRMLGLLGKEPQEIK